MLTPILAQYFHLTSRLMMFVMLGEIILLTTLLHGLVVFLSKVYLPKLFPSIGKSSDIRTSFGPWLYILLFSWMSSMVGVDDYMKQPLRGHFNHFLHIVEILSAANLFLNFSLLVKKILWLRFHYNSLESLRHRAINTQFQFIEKLITITVWGIALVAIICSFENARNFGRSLLASAGIVGVVLGFAAQKSLANLLAGFHIAFTQPIRLDDVVIVEGQWGRVEEITLTYVVICLWDLRRLVVPINYFLEKPFENWTRSSTDLLPFILIYTDYAIPVEEVRREFESILKGTDYWDGKVAVMHVFEVTERSLVLRALMSSANATQAAELRFYVREKLIRFLQDKYPEFLPKTRFSPDWGPKESQNWANAVKVPTFSSLSPIR